MSTFTPVAVKNCRAKNPATCRYHGGLTEASPAQIAAADRAELENDYNADRSREAFRARHGDEIIGITKDLFPGQPVHYHVNAVVDAVRDVLIGIKSTAAVTNAEVAEVTERLFPDEPLANHAIDVRAALQRAATPYVYKPGFTEMNQIVAHVFDDESMPPGWSLVRQNVEDTGKTKRVWLTVRNDVMDQYFTFTGTDAYGFSIRQRQANGNLRQVDKPTP